MPSVVDTESSSDDDDYDDKKKIKNQRQNDY
jgi:hypothetical protein